ncbi:MAG: YggT family protein [Alphaproteobacteria bacterium]
MKAIIDVFLIALDVYWWIIIASAILSWLIAFNVVNYRNQIVAQIDQTFRAMTEPLLAPIRSRLPAMGAVDLSPLVLLLGIVFVRLVILYYIRPYVF